MTNTALLVIDAIESKSEDSVYDPKSVTAKYRAAVAQAVALCHDRKIPVIYCNDAHIPGIDKELELWGEHGVKGEMRLFSEIAQAPEDFLIEKRRYSAFFETDLDLTLRELGISELLVCGADTNICVLHTLADAFYRNYATTLIEDATMTFLCGTQEAAIEHITKCFGTKLTSCDALAAQAESTL